MDNGILFACAEEWEDITMLLQARYSICNKWLQQSGLATKPDKTEVLFFLSEARRPNHYASTGMKGVLNLYLDPKLNHSWMKASVTVAKVEGHGVKCAQKLQEWILAFAWTEVLPVHHYGQSQWNVLDDEDVAQALQTQLLSHTNGRYIMASDVVEVIAGPVMQEIFSCSRISHPTISDRTARCWLQWLNWCYGTMRNGMYLDGHEREDVVAYRKAFIARWEDYEKRFHTWDSDGVEHEAQNLENTQVKGGQFWLILVTHDESVFYQNDIRKTH